MGGNAGARFLVAAACCLVALASCGPATDDSAVRHDARAPLPAPRVVLGAHERQTWAPLPPDRSAIPVLVYPGVQPVDPERFARQMTLLDHAGYATVTLDQFVRFVRGERVAGLPGRPFLLTFDDGRAASWTATDGILRQLGFNAVLFVDVGRVEEKRPQYLTWDELDALQRSGRWDVQMQSGTGHRLIHYGPGRGDVGPFYAYRGSDEVLGGWRERVFSDITWGEGQLVFRVHGYRPLAVAPPYGNYGQAGTNDPRIPRELLARLLASFKIVFTQDRDAFASPGDDQPLGRIAVRRDVTDAELRDLLRR